MFFPLVAGACADSAVALGRIGQFLLAEEQEEPYTICPEAELAINAEGDFSWETAHACAAPTEVQPDVTNNSGKNGEPSKGDEGKRTEKILNEEEKSEGNQGKSKDGREWFGRKDKSQPVSPTDALKESKEEENQEEKDEEKPFGLNNLDFKVQKGSFVVVLGSVGSGKVSVSYAQSGRSCTDMNTEFSAAGSRRRDA